MSVNTEDLVKVWFNPELKWFEIFDKNGNEISNVQGVSITIADNFNNPNKRPFCSLTAEMLCQVVNERPKCGAALIGPNNGDISY